MIMKKGSICQNDECRDVTLYEPCMSLDEGSECMICVSCLDKGAGMPMQIQRPARGPNQGNICPRCNTIMLLIEKPKGTSVGGVFGAFLFAFGLIRLLGNPLIGILLMILGLLVSVVFRGKKLVLLCPSCKYEKTL
jgi:hypothetical protein